MLSAELEKKLTNLSAWLQRRVCVVAFSGGVDSVTLAKALTIAYSAEKSDDRRSIGIFAESASSTAQERSEARRIADEVGIELRVFQSTEFEDERFVENSPMRCYWCKKIRFASIKTQTQEIYEEAIRNGEEVVVIDGTNADDLHDFRPGSRAAQEVGVLSPFAELGITKSEIRALAEHWNLSVAHKPSNPCLATRITYHMPLEIELLRKIEEAEIVIKKYVDVETCRARVDSKNVLRIEVPERDIEKFLSTEVRTKITSEIRELGFDFVTLDLEGFYSGKNNRVL